MVVILTPIVLMVVGIPGECQQGFLNVAQLSVWNMTFLGVGLKMKVFSVIHVFSDVVFSRGTLPETNIAHENHHLPW